MSVLSYDPALIDFPGEVERLRDQVAASWPAERRRLEACGLGDARRLLEVGCGPGFFTERLAAWLPEADIVALDPDPRMLALARARGAAALVEGTAEAPPPGPFDAAISRYLFQHLADPLAAAVAVRSVLRPGGAHVVIDVDDALWGIAEPAFADFADWHRRRALAQERHRGDRFRGRWLGRLLRAAGYVNVELDVFAYDSDAVGLRAFARHLDPQQFLPLLEEGEMTVTEFARASALHARFMREPDAFVLAVGFIARGEAPR